MGSQNVFKAVLRGWRQWIGSGRLRIALALVLVVGASVLFWASRDYTVVAPDWDGQVRGIAYNPSHVFTLKRQWPHHARADRPRHGAALAAHRPYPHLHGGGRHGQGAGDRAPLRPDRVAGLLDLRRPRAERDRDRRCASRPRSPTAASSTASSSATKRSCSASSRPISSTPTSSACARRCRRASRSRRPSPGRPGC